MHWKLLITERILTAEDFLPMVIDCIGNDSRFSQGYAIFIGDRVSLAHDSMVHGPAWIGNDYFHWI